MTNPKLNKYEMIIASAREARRLNDMAKLAGREFKVRPTTLAWDRLHSGKVNYTYEAERFEEPAEMIPDEVAPSPKPAEEKN